MSSNRRLNRAIRPSRRVDPVFTVVISRDRVVRTMPRRTLHAALRQLAGAWENPPNGLGPAMLAFAYDTFRGIS